MNCRGVKQVVFKLTISYLFISFGNKFIQCNYMQCASERFWKTSGKIELNNIEKRIGIFQHNANEPLEDRYSAYELKNFKGYFVSVLDGHGGHQLAEFANERLYKYFDNFYNEISKEKGNDTKLSEDEIIYSSLIKTFDKVEQEFYQIAKNLYNDGQGRLATVGSCVTIILISPSKIYSAQLGDSKAKLFRKGANDYDVVKLTDTHNSEKIKEQVILRKEFQDKDIIICKRPNNKVCYVKGRLQPTRSLGDFHLKYKEFNQFYEKNYKTPISNFNGPYIKSTPDIKFFDITDNDQYIVIGTDGLWDFLSSKDVANVIKTHRKKSPKDLAVELFRETLLKAANESSMTVSQIMSLPAGSKKRRIHDDISLIVFDLRH